MSSFVSSLITATEGGTAISATGLWNAIDGVAPLIIVLVLFALARRVINKNLRAASKGTSGKI